MNMTYLEATVIVLVLVACAGMTYAVYKFGKERITEAWMVTLLALVCGYAISLNKPIGIVATLAIAVIMGRQEIKTAAGETFKFIGGFLTTVGIATLMHLWLAGMLGVSVADFAKLGFPELLNAGKLAERIGIAQLLALTLVSFGSMLVYKSTKFPRTLCQIVVVLSLCGTLWYSSYTHLEADQMNRQTSLAELLNYEAHRLFESEGTKVLKWLNSEADENFLEAAMPEVVGVKPQTILYHSVEVDGSETLAPDITLVGNEVFHVNLDNWVQDDMGRPYVYGEKADDVSVSGYLRKDGIRFFKSHPDMPVAKPKEQKKKARKRPARNVKKANQLPSKPVLPAGLVEVTGDWEDSNVVIRNGQIAKLTKADGSYFATKAEVECFLVKVGENGEFTVQANGEKGAYFGVIRHRLPNSDGAPVSIQSTSQEKFVKLRQIS